MPGCCWYRYRDLSSRLYQSNLRLVRGFFRSMNRDAVIHAKLVPWHGRHIAAAGRGTLVKSILTSQVVFHNAPLVVSRRILQTIHELETTFLWSGTNKVSGGQCKVNWEIVCSPMDRGGLGVLNLNKFARALWLCWPWLLWNDPSKAWTGNDHPCGKADKNLFYVATSFISVKGALQSFGMHHGYMGSNRRTVRRQSFFFLRVCKMRAIDL